MDFGLTSNSGSTTPTETQAPPQSKMPNNNILSTYREQIRMAMMNYAKAYSLSNSNSSVVGIVNGCIADFEKKIKDKVDGTPTNSSSGFGFLGMGGMRKKKTSSKKKKTSSKKKNAEILGIKLKNIGLAGGKKKVKKSTKPTKKRVSKKKNAEILGIKLKNIGLAGGKKKVKKSSTKKTTKKRVTKKKNSEILGIKLKNIGLAGGKRKS